MNPFLLNFTASGSDHAIYTSHSTYLSREQKTSKLVFLAEYVSANPSLIREYIPSAHQLISRFIFRTLTRLNNLFRYARLS